MPSCSSVNSSSSLSLTLGDLSGDENQNEDKFFESESSDPFTITDTDENAHNDADIAEFPESVEELPDNEIGRRKSCSRRTANCVLLSMTTKTSMENLRPKTLLKSSIP